MQSLRDPNRNFITEAVIGSLPAALPADERQRIQASTPLSTTLNKFSSMPRDKVTSPTPEGQRLRRNALKGALLVFITAGLPSERALNGGWFVGSRAGSPGLLGGSGSCTGTGRAVHCHTGRDRPPPAAGKRFVFEKAKELGVRVVLIDGPESWSKVRLLHIPGPHLPLGCASRYPHAILLLPAALPPKPTLTAAPASCLLSLLQVLVEEGVIEWFVPLDMSDADTVFHRCLAAIRKVHHVSLPCPPVLLPQAWWGGVWAASAHACGVGWFHRPGARRRSVAHAHACSQGGSIPWHARRPAS